MEYYGTRRNRNINLSHFRKENQVASIAWENEDKLEEGYEYEEIDDIEGENQVEMESVSDGNSQEYFSLDGKPFKLKHQSRKQSFSETHIRTTTYLEKNVHQIIRMLQQQNQIESITKFINNSIKYYLTTKYSD
ncbi:hypothetical protein [Falsibacillus pallidus]|uniref:hypothetical protein n=1 Tax=Falsibacillus pallidus TaxID=493781 RepID=UPI003D9594E3